MARNPVQTGANRVLDLLTQPMHLVLVDGQVALPAPSRPNCPHLTESQDRESTGRHERSAARSGDSRNLTNKDACQRVGNQRVGLEGAPEVSFWKLEKIWGRRTDDLRVAHHLWNAERRERDTGDNVWSELRLIEWQKSLQDWQGSPPLTSLLVVGSCSCHDLPEIGCQVSQRVSATIHVKAV